MGTHTQLNNELRKLKRLSDTLIVEKETDRHTYTIREKDGGDISKEIAIEATNILKRYSNYVYVANSPDLIQFRVNFGWMPPNASSYLNILNEETLLDYYIDGVILRPNTHNRYGGPPESGYVCYRIPGVRQYNTIMFLKDKDLVFEDGSKIVFASLLNKLQGSKGATLNRIAEVDPVSAFYELGPYNQNYLTATDSSLIIQVPYQYAVSDMLFVYDVTGMIQINNQNNPEDPNAVENFYLPFDDEDFDSKVIFNTVAKDNMQQIVETDKFNILDTVVGQYLLGNFIWKTSDFKLISYAQNLIRAMYNDEYTGIVVDGVWSDLLSDYIRRYKRENNIQAVFDDDVLDKTTERLMLFEYGRRNYGSDPNVDLFKEW